MIDATDLQAAVAAQFTGLARLLSTACDATWDTESLCAGWRVREVVAHMTMPDGYSAGEFMAELERCGYDFTRLSNEIASKDAELHLPYWSPTYARTCFTIGRRPKGGYHGALNHAVIHRLDVTVPLGETRLSPMRQSG